MLGSRYGWTKWLGGVDESVLEDEQYAWILEYPDVSITEIEIISALERNSEHHRAFFYLKDEIPNEEKKLVSLKARVKKLSIESKLIHLDYYANPDDFRKKTEHSLLEALEKLYPKDVTISALEKQRVSHQIFAQSREKIYILHSANELKLSQFMQSSSDRLLLYGASGLGKSALVVNFFKKFKTEHSNYFVIEHYIGGAGAFSSDFYQMLKRVMEEIKERFAIDEPLPNEPQQIVDDFALWLNRVTEPTVIIFDGYNQIEDEMKEKLFYYLPKNLGLVKLIITSIEEQYDIALKENIEPLNRDEKVKLIEKYLHLYGKRVEGELLEKIVAHIQTDNTLFLRTIIEEIRLIGSFEQLTIEIENYLQATDTIELFDKIFARFERDYETKHPNLTQEILSLLYVSRDGLSESDLMEIVGVSRLEFSTLFLAIEEHLVSRSGLYGFFHDYIREAVQKRYLNSNELVNRYRKKVADYFENYEKLEIEKTDIRRVRELPFQLFEMGDRERLYRSLLDVDFFVGIQEVDEYELLKYVRFVDELHLIDNIVEHLLAEDYQNSYYLNNIAIFIHQIYTKYHKALPLYEKIVKLSERYTVDDFNVSYNNLALLYKEIGDYDKALSIYQKLLNAFDKQDENLPIVYNNIAQLYQSIGEFEKTQSYMEKSLKLSLETLGKNHTFIAVSYANLAVFYSFMGKYKKALELSKVALKIRKRVLGKHHPTTAISYNNLASLYKSLGEYDKTLLFHDKALQIQKHIFGENHPHIATSYANLANYYSLVDNYQEAIVLHRKSITIRKQIFGEYHSDIASNYDALAIVYSSMGVYDKAEVLYKKALDIREKLLGKQHNNTAVSYNHLAEFYKSMGRYQEALALFEDALEISQKSFGENHPNVATISDNLALLYHTLGEYQKALPLFENALKIREEVFGVKHHSSATSYNNLALLYYSIGEYPQALSFFHKSLEIREEVLGINHTDTASSCDNLSEIYKTLGEYQEALQFAQKALKIREDILGTHHVNTAVSYSRLGLLYEILGDYSKALPLLEKSLTINLENLGEEHINTAKSYNNLGLLYDAMEKLEDSLDYYTKALQIKKSVFSPQHPSIATVYNNIATVYEKIGDNDSALEYYHQAIAIRKKALGKHFDTASSYNNVAVLYYKMGVHKKAFLYMQKAVEIWEEILDENHPYLVGAKEGLEVMKGLI